MKHLSKAVFLFYCFFSVIAILSYTSGHAKAKKIATTSSSLDNSPLYMIYKGEENPDVKVDTYTKNILHSDAHTLTLKNVKKEAGVTFKSSNTSILKVKKLSDSKCRYTGVGYGKAEIIISIQTGSVLFFWNDETTLRVKISVSPHATSVKWVKSSKTITVGKKVKLGLTIRPSVSKEVPVFRSKNKKIVTINAKGQITGKKAGRTYVTARIDNGKIARCRIIVKKKKTVTPKVTSSPKPTVTPKPTASPKPTSTPKSSATPKPTSTQNENTNSSVEG